MFLVRKKINEIKKSLNLAFSTILKINNDILIVTVPSALFQRIPWMNKYKQMI